MPPPKYTPAKRFSLSAGPTFGTKSLGTSQSITFSVPDEEENDSHSELSDDSVQVRDSNCHAYSVPFSDDELDSEEAEDSDHPSSDVLQSGGDDENHATENDATMKKASSASQQHVKVWTEPPAAEELQFVRSSKAQDCIFTSAEIIVTKQVERSGSSAYNSLVVGSDSEDDAPEVLPSKPRQHSMDQRKPPATTLIHPASKYQSLPSFDLGGQDQGHQIAGNDGTSASDAVLTGSEQDSLQKKPIPNSTGESSDDLGAGRAGSDDSSCLPQGRCDFSERSFASASRQAYPGSCVSSLSATEHTSEGELVKYWPQRSLSDQSHIHQENQLRAAQRPPSPSDAALARNGPTYWYQEGSDRDGEFQTSYNYASLPYARDPPVQKSSMPWNNFGTPSNNTRENSLLDVGDGPWSRYDDGPFAHRTTLSSNSPLSPSLHQVPHLEPIAQKLATAPPQAPIQAPIAFPDEVIPFMERGTESTSPTINEKATSNFSEEPEHRRKSNDGHSSRLNIMDIVNPLTDSSRSLKRKAEEMSTNDEEKNDNEPITEASEEGGLISEGVIGENNQEKDSLIPNCELPSQDPALPLPQLSEESAVSSLAGPVRKKQKTSDSSAIGIGKFVSGVLVGVVGAFAAFVATIPMSVQNEALQEISRAS